MGSLGPQSNQRGIETRITTSGMPLKEQCLNRTSVGLKLKIGKAEHRPLPRLNRTSVGLKLSPRRLLGPGLVSLNRTSVGLKQLLLDKQQGYAYNASIEPAWD